MKLFSSLEMEWHIHLHIFSQIFISEQKYSFLCSYSCTTNWLTRAWMSGLMPFIMTPVFRNIGLAARSWATSPAPPDAAWNPEIILIRELKKHIPVYVGLKWFLPTFQPFNMSDGILGIVILSCNSYKWIHIFLGVILQTFFKEYENNGTLHRKFEQFFRRATW